MCVCVCASSTHMLESPLSSLTTSAKQVLSYSHTCGNAIACAHILDYTPSNGMCTAITVAMLSGHANLT